MKQVLRIGLAFGLGLMSLPAFAAGNVELGKAKAVYCTACHGEKGDREMTLLKGGNSKLAGMAPDKFVLAMKAYRDGRRFHPMMQFFVMPLRDEDIEDMAAYYASLAAPK